jgi:hypothetical protein
MPVFLNQLENIMQKNIFSAILFLAAVISSKAQKPLTTYVKPLLGTAPLTNPADIGFTPP